ncbi:hypothetical protein T06_9212 [Trichinella sp. T6]|nr:hypothetical protein T06_9212 [Trichinella sp. T6]
MVTHTQSSILNFQQPQSTVINQSSFFLHSSTSDWRKNEMREKKIKISTIFKNDVQPAAPVRLIASAADLRASAQPGGGIFITL